MQHSSLVAIISQGKDSHQTDEQIFATLLAQGYKVHDINHAFDDFRSSVKKQDSVEHDTQRKTISIIVTIGAILIGASVFSFIASNWDGMSRLVKVIVIIVAMLVSYGIAVFLHIKSELHKTAHAFVILGCIIYGGGIFLIGQMFHLPVEWPDGFILWMIGVLFVLMVYRSVLLLIGAAFLAVIGSIFHPILILEITSGQNPVLLTSELVLFVGCITTFVYGYILHKRVRSHIKNLY